MKLFTIAKVLIVNAEGKVLLVKRGAGAPRRAGEWDLPGGFVDPGEDLKQAALREAQEEVGIVLPTLTLVYAMTERAESRFGSGNWLTFVGHADNAEVTLSYEHDDYQWVELSEAITLITYDRQQKMLAYVLENSLLG